MKQAYLTSTFLILSVIFKSANSLAQSNYAYCINEVPGGINGMTARVINRCGKDLKMNYCWGAVSCDSPKYAIEIRAGATKSIAGHDTGLLRIYATDDSVSLSDHQKAANDYLGQ